MAPSDSGRVLDFMFYKADIAYVKSVLKSLVGAENGTEKQSFIAILSIGEEMGNSHNIELYPIPTDNSEMTNKFLSKTIVLLKTKL